MFHVPAHKNVEHPAGQVASAIESDGTSGQDRKSYSDEQDRDSYAVAAVKHETDIIEQMKWIASCGGSRAGYIKKYGSSSDPDHHGDGGEAIFDADQAELRRRVRYFTDRIAF